MPNQPHERKIVALLFILNFWLTGSLAPLYIVGNTLFLLSYGSERIPYVYIATGIVAIFLFRLLAQVQKKIAISTLSVVSVLFVGISYFISWIILKFGDFPIVSFILLLLFPTVVQLNLITMGTIVGRLLDVRQIKRLFGTILAGGFSGFIFLSFGLPVFSPRYFSLVDQLLIAILFLIFAILFLVYIIRQFSQELATKPSQPSVAKQVKTKKGRLFKNPFAIRLLSYQTLSAFGSQLVIYLFLLQAEAQFDNATDLGNFFAVFGGGRNVLNVLFLFFIAGPFMSRYGMRNGLRTNPFVVLVLIGIMLLTTLLAPNVSLILFILACTTYVFDIILSAGVTNTAINTSYQTLLPEERGQIASFVEGFGVPLAFAIAGVGLIIFNALPTQSIIFLLVFTFVICLTWLYSSHEAYQQYSEMLLIALKRRILPDEVVLTLDDSSSLGVVERLLQSDRWRDVRLGLDLLASAQSVALPDHLRQLIQHKDSRCRLEAIQHLAQNPPSDALSIFQRVALNDHSPRVQSAALTQWGILGKASSISDLLPFLQSDDIELQKGASVGLWQGVKHPLVKEKLTEWVESPQPEKRMLATQVLAEIEEPGFNQWFVELLQDPQLEVREKALLAVPAPVPKTLLPFVISNLTHGLTRSAALKALENPSADILAPLSDALQTGIEEDAKWLLRACRHFHDPAFSQLLLQHLQHPHPTIRQYLLRTLAQQNFQASSEEKQQVESAIFDEIKAIEIESLTQTELGNEPVVNPLRRAIHHDIADAKERLFHLLSFLYDPEAVQRAATRLAKGEAKEKALALEMLEVNLSLPLAKLILPLFDGGSPKDVTPPLGTTETRLRAIVANKDGAWGTTWTQACADYAGIRIGFWQTATAGNEAMLSIIERVAELNQV